MEKFVLDKEAVKNSYLKIRGGTFLMRGSSMEPLIKEGYSLEIEPVGTGRLKIGDVVVFSYNSKGLLACHRIVGTLNRNERIFYLEKGDNSYYIGIVPDDAIIGRVKRVIDYDGIELPKTDFIINTFILNLLCKIIGLHHRFKDAVNINLKSSPRLPVFLSTVLWRFYCLLFKLALKVKE